MSSVTQPNSDKPVDSSSIAALLGYLLVAAILIGAYLARDLHLIDASRGLGYLLGVIGSTLMVLLLLYPLRKRSRLLSGAGAVRHWFRVHMIFGIVGPMLVVLHSNFELGSINGRVALFCTIVVASSGILGRYLYGKLRLTFYSAKSSMDEMQDKLESMRSSQTVRYFGAVDSELTAIERRVRGAPNGILSTLVLAPRISLQVLWKKRRWRRDVRAETAEIVASKPDLAAHEKRLLDNVLRLFDQRISLLLKFAQFQAADFLFSLWHIIHYPLFLVMVVAAIIHVLAVHMY